MASLVDDYMTLIKDAPSPTIFKQWAGISMVSAALERRVWHSTGAPTPFYPNIYVLLVAHPSIGKGQSINPALHLMRKAGCFHIAPMDVTRASLIKHLASERVRERVEIDGELIEYHSLMMASAEFGMMFQGHDINFMSVFNALYDCEEYLDNERVHRDGNDFYIPRPQLTLIAGTQPKFLVATFPEAAWSQGFMSRMIMIHSRQKTYLDLYRVSPWNGELAISIMERLKLLKEWKGEIKAEPDAQDAIREWLFGGEKPVPTNPRLLHYNGRRLGHLLKLSMISAASELRKTISLQNYQTAMRWMLDAEEGMPHIFRDMAGLTEARIILEMWDWAIAQYVSEGYRPIAKGRMISYLKDRIPHYQLFQTFNVAVESGAFRQEANTPYYTPQPKHTWFEVE